MGCNIYISIVTIVDQELSQEFSSERDSLSYKQLLEQLKVRLDYVWLSAHSPSVSRSQIRALKVKKTGMKMCVQDKSRIWGAGGAALSLPHHVHRFLRSSWSFNNGFAFRTIFSLILGSNEDGLKAPEGLHH